MDGINYYIIINIVASCFLLISLYEKIYAGEFIIETRKRISSIIYIIGLVVWSYVAIRNLIDYITGKSIDVQEILQITIQIQICILWILMLLPSEITKDDMYSDESIRSYFAKSKRIKNYLWISDNIVQFEIFTRKNSIITTELEVNLEKREEVDEFLKKNIKKIDETTNKKRIFKLRIVILVIAIIMAMGHISLIKAISHI